jgi:polyferredoxin
MGECVYCGHELAENEEKCPACGQEIDLEPAEKSAFARRYQSCCRTRLSMLGVIVGMIGFCTFLYLYWLPEGASAWQMAALLLPGMFVGAILGVYAAAAFAMLLAGIGGGEAGSPDA